ncbi:MAG TPA: peptidoglycan DD-metalloendopeptidase family protein [Steroidobacteraceae bacterium]|nr:peptidoglycan DD-metalloendopeptidase family protein [Steroidobacteraceae bacterium]
MVRCLQRASSLLVVLLSAVLLASCSSTPERRDTYTVKRGDTLSAIASRHKLEWQDLARWNGIGRDYVIHPGQVLKLYPSRGRAAAAGSPARQTARASVPSAVPVQWQWPVEGGIATLTSRPNGGQGLTVSGQLGAEIHAAAAGRVVYTGSGLLGYGQLVILKHNETYLSAYGHTQSVAVREGDAVAAGQRIATMGAGPQGDAMLYFEIRVNGTPGNPLTFLPRRAD